MMKKRLLLTIIILISAVQAANAQSGMHFQELADRIDEYFAPDLIEDIRRQLPQGSEYTIWGWDVGDFSGDGYNDLAITIKLALEKKRVGHVYMFVDIDGFLTQAGTFPLNYVDLPLEIGVVIKYGACYITKKNKQFDWIIRGYKFENGTLELFDEYSTKRINALTHEKRVNYTSGKVTEKYFNTRDGKVHFKTDYMTIPCYRRNRPIYHGYASEIVSYYVDYVSKGAFYWYGDYDASFRASSAYDDRYLYMTIDVLDDKPVHASANGLVSDQVEVWFDFKVFTEGQNRFVNEEGNMLTFRTSGKRDLYSFTFEPGNFHDVKASLVDVQATNTLYYFQKEALKSIRVVSSVSDSGYTLKFRIPFLVFSFESAPIDEGDIAEVGCTIVLHDIDNEFRPEEETILTSSVFDSTNPSSYGSLMFIPDGKWFGNTKNIYKADIIKQLQEYGY